MTDDQAEKMAREILAKSYREGSGGESFPSYAEMAIFATGDFTKCSIRAVKRALLLVRSASGGEA